MDPRFYDVEEFQRRTRPVYRTELDRSINFELGSYYQLNIRERKLTIKRISGVNGFCGYRSVADGCCEIPDRSRFEEIANNLRFEMIARSLESKVDRERFLKEKLTKQESHFRWADTGDFQALTSSPNFNFKIQVIGSNNGVWQVELCQNGLTEILSGNDFFFRI